MYFSDSEQDEQTLLEKTGVKSFDDLIPSLPKKHLNPGLGLPKGASELDLTRQIQHFASQNSKAVNFLGAGAYDHFVPAVAPALAGRGEFATAYTPYQPEASQGTLQTIFEFQSIVSEIYGMDLANASLYDGATALVEACFVAFRQTGRNIILVPDALHPHAKRTLQTYFYETGSFKTVTVACPSGVIDQADLDAKISQNKDQIAALVVQTPNFFGCLEDGFALAEKAKEIGALFIASMNPLAAGLIAPPGEFGADIAVGDGQPLGLPLSFGGPYVGLFACKKELMRKIPGRICGKTVDQEGKTGFVLTLQAREQHIRREKALSNICTNQNLCATQFTIHTSLLGPEGLRELAELNLQLAHYAADELKSAGLKIAFGQPFFNEFAVELPVSADEAQKKLLDMGLLAGLPLSLFYPQLTHHLLISVTEKRTKEDIDRLVSALRSLK